MAQLQQGVWIAVTPRTQEPPPREACKYDTLLGQAGKQCTLSGLAAFLTAWHPYDKVGDGRASRAAIS